MTTTTTPYRRKLIEVALPLDAINKESAREKSIRHGHPSTLHLWWARRPLAACRAVLFAQMVDDPSSLPDEFPTEEAQEAERQRLFRIIEELVKWENTTNEAVLHAARVEIARSAARNHGVSLPHRMTPAEVAAALKQYAPPVLDPFAGGGSIPLEAQRLGLEAHASDLNPVAVLINKALIEIPPRFAGRPPVNPESRAKYLSKEWRGAQGLAEDVRYYGKWMRDEAFKRIGGLYPKVRLPKEQGGGEATVIAWLWARTVICPNPACGARMPLAHTFDLSTKKGKVWSVQPVVDHEIKTIRFDVKQEKASLKGTMNRRGAECIVCHTHVPFEYIRAQGYLGRLGAQMMAIVTEIQGRRAYLPPTIEQEAAADTASAEWAPDAELSKNGRHMSPPLYGMHRVRDLFTKRQLAALNTLCDLVLPARKKILDDEAIATREGNVTPDFTEYANAVGTYLGLTPSKAARFNISLSFWRADEGKLSRAFGRPAASMAWDYAETNPFANSGGDFAGLLDGTADSLVKLCPDTDGTVSQTDAATALDTDSKAVVSTDPPYYDNVPYADLSDIFYVWLRRSLQPLYPDLFTTVLVPKGAEIVADPLRQNGKEEARHFFENKLGLAFSRLHAIQCSDFPGTVYYGFKQSEADDNDLAESPGGTVAASTGWETLLEGLLAAGFLTNGTWPIRTEGPTRMRGIASNALASSIVLVCRPRPVDAPLTTRRDFLNALKRELPTALRDLQRGLIAPVDLAQAAIGPGMAVFSRYSKVLESDGNPMKVRTALQLINQTLDEVLAEQEGEYDADTRWAVAWFAEYGVNEGPYGVAETLSKAKNTAVKAMEDAGIVKASGGKVRLLGRDELPENWNPHQDHRLSVWKVTQHLIRAVMLSGVSSGEASALLDAVGSEHGDKARDLAYRLYTTSERRKWTQEALAYNTLVTEWHDIAGGVEQIRERDRATVRQGRLIEE